MLFQFNQSYEIDKAGRKNRPFLKKSFSDNKCCCLDCNSYDDFQEYKERGNNKKDPLQRWFKNTYDTKNT
jgi:hypothetical protein